MQRTWLITLVGTVMFWAVQARAQDAETIADIRCIVVGFRMSQLPNPAQQTAGTMAALYYIGRLEGRMPNLDIEELMITEIGRMTATDYDSEAKRCGSHLMDKGQQITRFGKDMVERGQKMQDKSTVPAK